MKKEILERESNKSKTKKNIMTYRLFVFFMALVSIVGGGLHYFISGEAHLNSTTRNVLVVLQILFGLVLAFFYRPKKGDSGK